MALGFHYMRYVVAFLGLGAATFLSMSQIFFMFGTRHFHYQHQSFSPISGIVASIGAIVLTLLSGAFMKKLSAKWIVVTIILVHLLISALYQPIEERGYSSVIFILVHIGMILHSIMGYVAIHALISNWSPPAERTLITSIILSGNLMASICISLLPLPLELSMDPYIIIAGIIIIVWMILWGIMIDDSPQQKKRLISKYEKNYIQTSIGNYWPRPSVNQGLSIWKILISIEFIALLLVQCSMTLIYTFGTYAEFRSGYYHGTGVLEVIGQIVIGVVWGALMTSCLHRKVLSFNFARKISCIMPNVLGLLAIVALYTQESHLSITISNFVLRVAAVIQFSGTLVNIIDIAPNFAPLFAAFFQVLDTFVPQLFLALRPLTTKNLEMYEGIIIMSSTAVVVLITSVIYWFWGSAAQKSSLSEPSDAKSGQIHFSEQLKTEPSASAEV